jgi:allantoin racemase
LRIMLIGPGDFSPEELAVKEQYAKSVCSPGTTPVLTLAETSSPPPKDFSMFSYYVPGILQKVKEAEREGYDAVIIDCFTDTGLEPAKIAANIPIVGPAEASLHLSCLLADKFGQITPMDKGIPFHWRQATNYGLADRITSIKAVNMSLQEIGDRKDKAEARLLSLAEEMIEEGAQLVLVGCMGIFPALGIGSVRKLSEKAGAPFIDPLSVTLKTAEILASLNLCQSKLAFPHTIQLF